MIKQRRPRMMIFLAAVTIGCSAITFGQAQDAGLSITGRSGQEDAITITDVAGTGLYEPTSLERAQQAINIGLGLAAFFNLLWIAILIL